MTWVKLHCFGILHGSIAYQLEEAEQAVWMKLLALAGIINRGGQISDNDGRPYPKEFIAHEIHTIIERLDSTLKKCIDEGRITEDEKGLHITNWKDYQSEYNRQKASRDTIRAQKDGKAIHKVCPGCGHKELTNETYCPKCSKKGKEIELNRDYKAGKYGHMVEG